MSWLPACCCLRRAPSTARSASPSPASPHSRSSSQHSRSLPLPPRSLPLPSSSLPLPSRLNIISPCYSKQPHPSSSYSQNASEWRAVNTTEQRAEGLGQGGLEAHATADRLGDRLVANKIKYEIAEIEHAGRGGAGSQPAQVRAVQPAAAAGPGRRLAVPGQATEQRGGRETADVSAELAGRGEPVGCGEEGVHPGAGEHLPAGPLQGPAERGAAVPQQHAPQVAHARAGLQARQRQQDHHQRALPAPGGEAGRAEEGTQGRERACEDRARERANEPHLAGRGQALQAAPAPARRVQPSAGGGAAGEGALAQQGHPREHVQVDEPRRGQLHKGPRAVRPRRPGPPPPQPEEAAPLRSHQPRLARNQVQAGPPRARRPYRPLPRVREAAGARADRVLAAAEQDGEGRGGEGDVEAGGLHALPAHSLHQPDGQEHEALRLTFISWPIRSLWMDGLYGWAMVWSGGNHRWPRLACSCCATACLLATRVATTRARTTQALQEVRVYSGSKLFWQAILGKQARETLSRQDSQGVLQQLVPKRRQRLQKAVATLLYLRAIPIIKQTINIIDQQVNSRLAPSRPPLQAAELWASRVACWPPSSHLRCRCLRDRPCKLYISGKWLLSGWQCCGIIVLLCAVGWVAIIANKFMNLFPLIHPSKKAPHFANPLSGLLFHSELEAATKEALSTISYSEASRTRRAGSNASSLKAKSNYKFQLDHSASPDGQLHAAAKSSKVLKAAQLFAERVGQRATLLRSESSLVFQFPDVEIIPLDLVNCYEDIGRYKIKANLEKYFQLFFSKGLRHNLPALNRLLEKYLPLLGKFGVLDREVEKKKWPKEFWEVGRAEELAALMQRYDRPSEYWVRYLLVLVQLYCVPHPAVRQSSLQNLLLLTRHHISHLFESQPHPDCVFLLEDGALVRDFLDIPFSATRLYLTTQKATHQQTVQPYFNLLNTIQNYKEECKKRGFVGRLRRHFRNEIALNKYNEDSVNYEADHSSKEKERKISLYNAMMILQRKKQSQSTHAHTKTLTVSSARPKSREQIWKEENVESGSSHEGGLSKLSFHLYINNPRFQGATRQEFGRYHGLSLQQNQQLQQDRLYVHVLQKQHPVLKAMMGSTFHAPRVKAIFQTIMKEKLSDNRELSRTTISWECFLEFSVLSSKTLGKLIEMPDCMQLVRRFVEDFLGMGGEDYYRDELTSKLYRMIDADRATLSMVEELVWSWLSQNSFVRMGAVQRELLWTYHERSKTFYLLVVSTIFATYSTTPIDLAFELML